MKKIIMLLLAASLFFTPLSGIVAYAEVGTLILDRTETTETPETTETQEIKEIPVVITEPTEEEILTLTLQEAIGFALLNNKEMQIQNLELAKAEISYKENKRAIEKAEDGAEMLEKLGIPRSYEVTPDQIVNNALIEKGVSMKQVELALLSAQMNVEMKENQIKYNVEKAYFDLLQKEKELLISGENLALTQKQYDNGKLRYDLGMISKQQLLGLELGLSQAQSGYDAAKMVNEIQLLSFKTTLGLALEKEIDLTGEIEIKEYEPIDLEESIKLALENNAGIIMAKENAEIQPLILEATSGRFPPITFRYRQQEVEVAKAEESLQQAMVGVEMGVRTSILNLKTSEEQIATFQKAVTMATETVKIAELSFELGQNTPADVLEANINLMSAKKNLAQQIHAFNTALLDYRYSMGLGKGI
ncbi:MAG: TolC family protein [Gudongella sp.]|nr:TolC family protein [Gudongella sp.]